MSTSRSVLQIPSQLIKTSLRFASTTAAPVSDVDPEWNNAKPFKDIPGPKPLPIPKYGNFHRMILFGSLANKNAMEIHQSLHGDYGEIVKFAGFGRADMVMLYDPKDAEKLYRNESAWPNRPGLDSIDYYRRITRYDIYKGNPGILSSQGEEWQKHRTAVNQPLMRPKNVKAYKIPIEEVASEFIEKIKVMRDENLEVNKDFSNELNKWALESISLIALDTRLGCMDANLKKDCDAQIMIDSVEAMFSLMYKLDFLPSLWKYFSTTNWRKFVKAMDNITRIANKHVTKKVEEIKTRDSGAEGNSMLEILLSGEGGQAVAMSMAMDMMMAGIDTTSNTSGIALYFLAKNPEAQEKVFKEVKKILPNLNDELPADYSSSIPYLKACIKESQRLRPLAPGNARRLPKDVVLRGYQIPKGTDVAILNMIICHMEKYFPRPEEFIPERWLKSEKGSELSVSNAHPFASLPFGFGPRMCVGRRLAELEMHTLLTKIIRNFQFSYNYGEMEWLSEILIKPKNPLRFKFVNRT